MVKPRPGTRGRLLPSKRRAQTTSSSWASKLKRAQLLKLLADLGIHVPPSLPLPTLRDLVARNCSISSSEPVVSAVSPPRNVPLFDGASIADPTDDLLSPSDHLKPVPRTYTLFNCPVVDVCHPPAVVEYLPPALRKAIQAGKDVCLAHLLIPQEHSFSQYKESSKDFTSLYLKPADPRLHRSLSLPDFMLAFVRYLNVMMEVHPERRAELTSYLSFVVKLGVQFPAPLFYEYHKSFSRKAASILTAQGRKIDWSVRDDEIYFQLFAGCRARTCTRCSSVDHSSDFCPSIIHGDLKSDIFNVATTVSRSPTQGAAKPKRTPVLTADHREVCFNFNGPRGCSNPSCARAHVCLKCLQPHSQKDCRSSSAT